MTSQLAADDVAVTIPAIQVVDVPAHDVTAYAQSFDSTTDSWAVTGGTLTLNTAQHHSSPSSLYLGGTSTGTYTMTRTISGLLVGHTYTFTAWVLGGLSSGQTVKLGVTGIGSSTPVNAYSGYPAFSFTQLTYTFTATSTSHVLEMYSIHPSTGGTDSFWDDVSVIEHVATTYRDFEADVKSYRIALDESRAPYVQADITIATPEQEIAEQIDPTDDLRVSVVLTKAWTAPVRDPQTMTLDLALRARTNTAESGETSITLYSDEAVLIDDMQVATIHDYESYTDLRTLVAAVLGTYGWTLDAGNTETADITRTSNATNLLTNPSGMVSNTGYAKLGTGASGPTTNVGTDTYVYSDTGAIPAGNLGTLVQAFTVGTDLKANTTYTFSAEMYAYWDGSPRTYKKVELAAVGAGAAVTGAWVSPTAPTTFLRGWVKFTTGTSGTVNLYALNGEATVAGAHNLVIFRKAMLLEGDWTGEPQPYFDGTRNDDATHYAVAWTGTADASTSTRTRLDDRSADALTITPGQKSWDFLSPMIQAAGLRLFADESRVWRLVPSGYTVPGQINVAEAYNLTSGSDTIDLSAADTGPDAGPAYFLKVVVTYSWISSADGTPQTAYDVAGSGVGPGLLVNVAAPYPGPGAAAAILARGQGRKRVIDVSALADLAARPGMAVAATLPIVATLGTVSGVTWSDDDTMTLAVRAALDIPATAWALQPEGYRWQDVPSGQTWPEYETPA